jgi:hypothetical protein
MNLEAAIALRCGGPGSGCHGANCGRKKNLSQAAIKKEVARLTPLMQKVGEAWKKEIKKLDPKAQVTVNVQPTGLFYTKNSYSPTVLQKTWGVNVWISGTSSKDERFGLGLGLFPEGDGNTVKIQDSGLPDRWLGKGVFSAGMAVLTKNPEFDLNKEMVVHVDTNPKVWLRLAEKHGFHYDRS